MVDVPGASTNGSQQRLAVLGDLEAPGVRADRYGDLAALGEAIAGGAAAPDAVLAAAGAEDRGNAEAARAATFQALELIQAWIADERLTDSRLVLVTSGAVAAAPADVPDLAAAPTAGLVRSAQSEHPGRFVLVDVDDAEASWRALSGALVADEPQLALRDGAVRAPRLAWATAAASEAPALDPDGTVLVTGGTSGLGALLARHWRATTVCATSCS